MVKVPLSNSFLEKRNARRKFSESLGAGASLAPRTRQRISLGSENDWKFRLWSCQSWKASSLNLAVVVPTEINKYRMRYVGLRRDSLRSHFVFRPRHAPKWLRAGFLPVVFLANKEELTGKTYRFPQHHKPWHICEIHFLPNFPFNKFAQLYISLCFRTHEIVVNIAFRSVSGVQAPSLFSNWPINQTHNGGRAHTS